jgi:hypothetical protein
MKFIGGAGWTGNSKGRPLGKPNKDTEYRVQLTKQLVESNWNDSQEIVGIVAREAKIGNQWALKLYCTTVLPYFLVKPKAEVDITQQGTNGMTEEFKALSAEQIELIGKIVSGDKNELAN